jgi:hypothetical protein
MYAWVKDHKRLATIAAGSLALIVLVIVVAFIARQADQSRTAGEISITNLSQFFGDLPRHRRQAIQATLYNAIATNGHPEVDIDSVDGVVRAGTAVNEFDQGQNMHQGHFVVDIEHVQQSYYMTFRWSDDDHNPSLGGYVATVSCLSPELLIYGDFSCRETVFQQDTPRDQITTLLPEHNENFSITLDSSANAADGKLSLAITIILLEFEYDADGQPKPASLERQHRLVREWFTKRGLAIDNYQINYVYH